MKEYTVTVEISSGGYTLEAEEKISAYSKEEAYETAESKVLDNISVFGTVDYEPEEDGEDFEIGISIEYQGYSISNSMEISTMDYTDEEDAKDAACEKTLDNLTINALSYEVEEEEA